MNTPNKQAELEKEIIDYAEKLRRLAKSYREEGITIGRQQVEREHAMNKEILGNKGRTQVLAEVMKIMNNWIKDYDWYDCHLKRIKELKTRLQEIK